MKASVEKQEKHLAVIELNIEAEHAAQEYNKACRRLGQRLNIPGFRRGKAPRNIIEKNLGVERIKQEALDRILPHAFADVISEHQLDIVAPPQIESYQFDLQSGISVKAQVELRPEVQLGSMVLSVKVPKYELPADAEQKEIDAILERMTTLEPVIDRPCEVTDIVNIDFTGFVNGEAIKGGAAKSYRLDLSNNNFIEGFAAQVIGHKLGEEFKIQVTFPADYYDNTLAGKAAEFTIKINEIKKRVVPELNDDLAKKIGPYETVEQLKAEIQQLLDQNVENENLFRKQKALIEEVVNLSSVEIPDPMVNREAKLLMEEVQQRFKSQGLSWEEFLDGQGHESIWENLREEARKRIKTSLVFGAISRQESLQVTEEEFSNQVQELAKLRNVDQKMAMRQLANQPAAVQALTDQILAQKIVEFLTEKATFEFVKDESDAAEGKPSVANSEVAALAEKIEGQPLEVLDPEQPAASEPESAPTEA